MVRMTKPTSHIRRESAQAPAQLSIPWVAGTAVTRWNVSAAETRIYRGHARPMPDTVTYEFVNGWTDTGDLPCREMLRQEIQSRSVTLANVPFTEVVLAEDGSVDFSDFCHIPELRARYAKVTVISQTAQTLRIRIVTAGGVHVWCDQDKVHDFEPFSRNAPQASTFDLSVKPGAQSLIVRFEDLHERDTTFGFRLDLLAGTQVQTAIALNADPDRLQAAMALLSGLRTVDVFHKEQAVQISSDALAERGFDLRCEELSGQGGHLSRTEPSFDLDMPSACMPLTFAIDLDDVTLKRRIGTTVLRDCVWLDGADFVARKAQLLNRHKCAGDIVNALLAARRGTWTSYAQDCLDEAIHRLEARHDCADFRLLSCLWILDRFSKAVPDDQVDRLTKAVLGFRYWLDEPGNDVMWFWSENHALCFHICQHLAGQIYPDEVFQNSGRTGRDQSRIGADRLTVWFDAVEDHGLAEWNSSAYYPINYRALVVLYTLTNDLHLKARAKSLLDQMSTMVALHQAGGVAAGTQGRIYEKELLAGPMTELGAVASMMFGGWHVPGKDAAAAIVAVSDYAPPATLPDLAYLKAGAAVRASYTQGFGNDAPLRLYKSAAVQLSSVEWHKPGDLGHQQHVLDVQFSANPLARLWINHPGVLQHWAEARPSYWAGNGRLPTVVQEDAVAALLYDLKDGDIPFTHLFLPMNQMDEIIADDTWVFCRAGDGFAAVWSNAPLQVLDRGLYSGFEMRQDGPVSAWVVHVGDAQHMTFDAFVQSTRDLGPTVEGKRLSVLSPTGPIVLKAGEKPAPRQVSRLPTIERKCGPDGLWFHLQDTFQ